MSVKSATLLSRSIDARTGNGRKMAQDTVTHGWTPERGFIKYRWEGYNEALILYVLGLASPTHPLPKESYQAWTSTYEWRSLYGYEFLYAGPLFIHQLSHMWIDFRGIQDEYMRHIGIDYFENSRRATYIQQQYAIHNPRDFKGYGEFIWGLTASDGPGPAIEEIEGKTRQFYDYINRGIPNGPDDGTLAPWAVIASLPFAPEIVLPSIRYFDETFPEMTSKYGFKCSFNPTFSAASGKGWISKGLLRSGSGSDSFDDRELSLRIYLAVDAKLPLHRHRASPRRVFRRLASQRCSTWIPQKSSKRKNYN